MTGQTSEQTVAILVRYLSSLGCLLFCHRQAWGRSCVRCFPAAPWRTNSHWNPIPEREEKMGRNEERRGEEERREEARGERREEMKWTKRGGHKKMERRSIRDEFESSCMSIDGFIKMFLMQWYSGLISAIAYAAICRIKVIFHFSSEQAERTTTKLIWQSDRFIGWQVDSQSDMLILYVSEERNLEHIS